MANKISCIYTITNLKNNKIYVGYAKNFKERKRCHFKELYNLKHKNKYLQNAVIKDGIENFVMDVIEECEEKFLVSLEHYWATILNVHNENYGYNILPTHPYSKQPKGLKWKLSEKDLQWRKDNYKLDPKRKLNSQKMAKLMQEKRIGTKHSTNAKKKMTKTKLGYERVIEIYNLDNELIKTVDFLNEASDFTGLKPSAIRNNLYNLSKSTRKFIFKYKII